MGELPELAEDLIKQIQRKRELAVTGATAAMRAAAIGDVFEAQWGAGKAERALRAAEGLAARHAAALVGRGDPPEMVLAAMPPLWAAADTVSEPARAARLMVAVAERNRDLAEATRADT